jgi:hypothetical protein
MSAHNSLRQGIHDPNDPHREIQQASGDVIAFHGSTPQGAACFAFQFSVFGFSFLANPTP